MGIQTSVTVDEILQRGSIRDSDVLRLKGAFGGEQALSADDAAVLIALHGACPVKVPTWAGFFIETIADFLVNQSKPEGYLVADSAAWLIGQVSQDGRVRTSAELELVVRVIERARWSPPSLARFVIDQVRHAVVTGTGPLRAAGTAGPNEIGGILPAEIALIRRTLLAFGGDSKITITLPEADALLAIDDALTPTGSSPLWTDFLVQAVGNAVLAALGREVPSRENLLGGGRPSARGATISVLSERQAGSSPAAGFVPIGAAGGLAGHIIAGGTGHVWSSRRSMTSEERALARLERQRLEIITNEPIAEPDEAWLVARLGNAADLGDNKIALLAFLQRESNGLPKGLSELAANVVIAA